MLWGEALMCAPQDNDGSISDLITGIKLITNHLIICIEPVKVALLSNKATFEGIQWVLTVIFDQTPRYNKYHDTDMYHGMICST